MSHCNPGDLRRMIDEPEAFDETSRGHVRDCASCADAMRSIRSDAAFVAAYLESDRGKRSARIPAAYAALAAAAVLVAALFTTPLGTYAQSLLTIFEPKQVVALALPPGAFSSPQTHRMFADFDQLGTFRAVRKSNERTVASLAAAQDSLPFRVLSPSTWPAQLPHVATYRVTTSGTESFTFSASKARAYSLRNAKRSVVIPPEMDGTRVDATVGPMVVAYLGQPFPSRGRHLDSPDDKPFLMFMQSVPPHAVATGVSLDQLKAFIAALPGVTPAMAAEIGALDERTLPIPFRPDKQNAHEVSVQGVRGLALGDNTGLGAGVIWEKNGVVYGIGGTLPENDVLAFANGLR